MGMSGPLWLWQSATGVEFSSRELRFGDNTAGATTQYALRFSGQSPGTVGSVRLQLCVEDPFPGLPCTAPPGLTMSTAVLASQSGMGGFSIYPSTTSNVLVLTRTPGPSVPGQVLFTLNNVKNPASAGTVYGRLETFASTDASGAHADAAGIAVAYLPSAIAVRTVVPPYLLFCVGNTIQGQDCTTAQGNYVDFGEFMPSKTSTGQTQFVVATNADFGFMVTTQGTTLTSGVNVIQELSNPDVSRKGVSQFGLNLRANSTPPNGQEPEGMGLAGVIGNKYSQPNYFAFNPGEALVNATDPDMEKYTVTYIANVATGQAPGIYVSTLTYIAVASF